LTTNGFAGDEFAGDEFAGGAHVPKDNCGDDMVVES
jgi:hypothetical protein